VTAEEPRILERHHFQRLLDALAAHGYRIVGPTVRDGAIIYDEIASESELPIGWTDEQDGGKYRLKRRADAALFGYVVGPQSWKKFLFPAKLLLWKAKRTADTFAILEEPRSDVPLACLGVRSCELHAIAVQDKVFLETDPVYRARREALFLVAVNCGQAGGTCFCLSMKTGPRAQAGFDLALTEVLDGERHYFVVEIGSQRGAEILEHVPHRAASAGEAAETALAEERASRQMGRSLETAGIKELLYRNYENPRWDQVAARCLSCANCTLVCPTCFCSTVEEVTDLTGDHAERWRSWDSCFTMDFSHLHGGSVRASTRSRYRQWLTHKLGTWIDQFGTSGCVGCGRCITWCPVAIDITEEVRAIRESEKT
jgi:formate hydrogenlyase subunit 6/NADH:ubiquinone oxidoreductase subunit I